METDWIMRVGDACNLINSSKYKIWGIQSDTPAGKYFMCHVKYGDRLWFVKGKSDGKLVAVATYVSHNERNIGPLISFTRTNEELGWVLLNDSEWLFDIEVHYKDLYNLETCELLTRIKGPKTIRTYNKKCKVNLPLEYTYIVKYSKVSESF